MESVLGKSSKVLVDSKNANNLMYLPIDQLLKQSSAVRRFSAEASNGGSNSSTATSQSSGDDQSVRPPRSQRETR